MKQLKTYQATLPLDRNDPRRGFALIITISLMAFLVLLLITVSTFTRIETQVSGYSQKQSIAREHAKMGMEKALGDLQKYAGADERVTARAEIMTPVIVAGDPQSVRDYWNIRNPYWTGVWDTTSPNDPPVWLVSGNEFFDMTERTAHPQDYWAPINADGDGQGLAVPDPADPDNRSVWVVGPGSARDANRGSGENFVDGRVKVEKQPIRVERYPGLGQNPITPPSPAGNPNVRPTGGHVIGHYAFWVGDEGVKASLGHAGLRRPYFEHAERVALRDIEEFPDDWDANWLVDEVVNTLSPARFGFEAWADDPLETGGFFEDYSPFATGDWLRVMDRKQAGLIAGNGGLSDDELRATFHDSTTSAQAVFANTVNGGGTKTDLSVNDPGNYGGTRATTDFVYGNPNEDGTDRIHPIAHLRPLTENASGAPVVKQVRLIGRFVKDNDYPDPGVNLVLTPQLEVWNPYTADLAWIDDPNYFGYTFHVRIAYDPVVDEGIIPDPLAFRLGAGIHWEGIDPETDESKEAYTWWFSQNDINVFELQEVSVNVPPFDDHEQNEDTVEFMTSGTGFGFSTGEAQGTRLLAGESAIFSGFGSIPSGVVSLFDQRMQRGRDGAGFVRNAAGLFDPTPPEALGVDIEGSSIVSAVPTLVLAPGQPQPRFRVQVYAVPETTTAEAALGTVDDSNRVPLLGSEGVQLVPEILAYDDVVPDEFGGTPEGAYGDGAAGETAWAADWDGNEDVTYYNFNDFLGTSSFHRGGIGIPFSFGVWRGNVVSYNLGQNFMDPRSLNFNNVWGGSGSQFYGVPPVVPAWGTDNGYGYGYSPDGVNGDPATQFVNLLEAPRLPFPLTTSLDTSFVSMAEWTGDANEPIRFNNPRVGMFSRSGTVDSEVEDNLRDANRADRSAFSLMADGAFNVNSTSVRAWAALLNSFARFQDSAGNPVGPKLQIWDPLGRENFQLGDDHFGFGVQEQVIHSRFPRFSHAPGATFFGRIDIGQVGERSIWRNGFRELRPLDLGFPDQPHAEVDFESLYTGQLYARAAIPMAEYIVAQIKQYRSNNGHPFRSLSEFAGSNILQGAIDSVSWGGPGQGLNWYRDPVFGGGGWEEIPPSSPSYLSQNDIFRMLGSVLTARSDTFVIRSYGDAHNPVTGEVEARAYLEAVVQRTPVPMNPSSPNNPTPAEYQNPPDVPGSIRNYGRKFEVISFRWLNPDEI